jgi:orotate phosphoribosyltransferase-like protein
MMSSDKAYAARVVAFTAIVAVVTGVALLGIGIASLVSDVLGGGLAQRWVFS